MFRKFRLMKGKRYSVLHQDKNSEARLYLPHKRTILSNGQYYYLPFPHTVFMRVTTTFPECRGLPSPVFVANLFVGFTTKAAKIIWSPPFGAYGFSACLDQVYHYDYPVETSFEDLIRIFWSGEFHTNFETMCSRYTHARWNLVPKRKPIFGGRLHEWAKLNCEQVEADVPRMEECGSVHMPLEDFLAERRYL